MWEKWKTLSFSTGKEYRIDKFILCKSTHVRCLIICPCGLQYVGHTKRNLCTRINEHLTNIKNGFQKHSLSNHFRIHHNRDPSLARFFGIDRLDGDWRGENMVQRISKNEMEWIYQSNTLTPAGINVDIDLNCYLSNFWIIFCKRINPFQYHLCLMSN